MPEPRSSAGAFSLDSVLSGGRMQDPTVFLGPVESNNFDTPAKATTRARSRAAVRVCLGALAGLVAVVIIVPTLGFQDIATYTVMPGAPARVITALKDTGLDVGANLSPRSGDG